MAPTHIAHTLLSQAHSPETASAIFTDKVLHKPLHLRPTSPDPTSQDARAQRRLQRLRKKKKTERRQKPKPLSAKEKRKTGIYDIPDDAKKYEIYVPLHSMWVGYMWEILGLKEGQRNYVTAQSAGSKLASADYHGSEMIVVRSRCVGMVGLAGIVVRDTKFTFQVITKKNELKSNRPFDGGVHVMALLTGCSYTQKIYCFPFRGPTNRPRRRCSGGICKGNGE